MRLRLAVLALAGVLAACGEGPRPDARSEQRGVPVSGSTFAPTPRARAAVDLGVASTDPALLVEEADRWR